MIQSKAAKHSSVARSTSVAAAVILIQSLGCSPAPAPADADSPVAVATAQAPASVFDPRTLSVGDTVSGFTVADISAERAMDSSWVGHVRFRDTLHVTGRVMTHVEGDHPAPCFELKTASAAQLPRWPQDLRRPWFCFENDSAATRLFTASPGRREFTIAIDRFTINRNLSDAVNSARILSLP